MQEIRQAADASGRPTAVINPPPHRCVVALSAGIAKSVPVPAGARQVLLAATGNVWVQYDGVPALPAGDALGGAAPELNPGARTLEAVSALGLVAPVDCLVSLGFYG
ncbi:NAD/NADP transhydrogenase alpha subunit-like protein [Azospirillum sp. ST 5-10]|uniref:NAD/NADP transhydrogenase alpha subunit-like protein n=1 Tax=unclassified Azospirillum TaxID=2630922 RepID=UPI003F4A544B